MSTSGEFDLFAPAFPNDMVPDVIQFLLAEWPNVKPPAGKPLENRITSRLAGRLTNAMREHDRPQFRFTCRPKIADAESDTEVGELDIQVSSFSPHPDAFLVVECKRLNVETDSGFQSRAGEYVGNDGMGCFINGQYDSGGNVGVMLGYVMTRTIAGAIKSIDEQLSSDHLKLRMVQPFRLADSTLMPNQPCVKETAHRLNRNPRFTIVHAFVSFGAIEGGLPELYD
jgi:hypothetical protein